MLRINGVQFLLYEQAIRKKGNIRFMEGDPERKALKAIPICCIV